MNRIDGLSSSKTAKSLMLASMLALSMNGVSADNLAPVPQNNDNSANKLALENSSNAASDKSYTLTKIQTGGEKPSGDNIVTKFTYNSETKTMVPVYYRMDLKQTTYGEGENIIGYNWINDNGYTKLEQVSNPTSDNDINLKYDKLNNNLNVNVDEDISSQQIEGVFANLNNNASPINNAGKIGDISADFINNTLSHKTSSSSNGGAIYNNGEINVINGTFIGNSATNNSVGGGAIYNWGSVNEIDADFIGNYIDSTYNYADGGALYNNGEIANITGSFLNNYIKATYKSSYSYGGAIYNRKTINNITADFIGNKIFSELYGYGGSIANDGSIGQVSGEFINNYVNGEFVKGAAIANKGIISDINANFIGNTVSNQTKVSDTPEDFTSISGGDMNSDFPMPSTNPTDSPAIEGGGIFNSSIIENISGNFIGNTVVSHSESNIARGGAISNTGVIGKYDSNNVQYYSIGVKP